MSGSEHASYVLGAEFKAAPYARYEACGGGGALGCRDEVPLGGIIHVRGSDGRNDGINFIFFEELE